MFANAIHFLIVFLLSAFIWQKVCAEYGAFCISPDNFSGKCVPVASCRNIDERLRNITATGGSIPSDFRTYLQQSKCGIFDNVRHICCKEDQIQFNANTMEDLRNLKCGKFIPKPKIYNGYVLRPWSRPWMALLGYNLTIDIDFNCGGTLISDRYVLTAAHCVAGFEDQLQFVRLGEHNISEKTDCVQLNRFTKKCFDAIDVPIERMIIHEKYDSGEIYNDIALLRLSKPVDLKARDLKNFISPICLPITDKLKNKYNMIQEFFVSGWGITENNTLSDVLMEVQVNKTTLNNCSNSFIDVNMRDSQICVGGVGNKDSCKGDSGGPLLAQSSYITPFPKRFVQFGIVSVGHKICGTAGYPAIYTNVAYYIQWITDKMASN